MEMEQTLALIKPDAVKAGRAEEIKQLIELHGFTIMAQQKLQLTKARAEEFYGEHLGKPFFPKLVDFMTSGPIWAMVLSKPDAIKGWRTLMGPTNVFVAREQAPRSIRALYGTDGTQNACHGSDSPTSALREIKFYFPNLTLEPLLDAAAASVYISTKIQPALSNALTALAREKPSAERFEAITFLAEYLLNNNPNKPRVVLPDAWDPSNEQEDDEQDFAHAQLKALEAAEMAARAEAQAQAAAEAEEAARAQAEAEAAAAAARAAEEEERAKAEAAAAEAAAAAAAAAAALPVPHKVMTSRPGTAEKVEVATEQLIYPGASRPESATRVVPSMPTTVPADSVLLTPPTEGEGEDTSEMHAAATKVQATFRGYQARKEVAAMRSQGSSSEVPTGDESAAAAAAEPTAEDAAVPPATDSEAAPPPAQDEAAAAAGVSSRTGSRPASAVAGVSSRQASRPASAAAAPPAAAEDVPAAAAEAEAPSEAAVAEEQPEASAAVPAEEAAVVEPEAAAEPEAAGDVAEQPAAAEPAAETAAELAAVDAEAEEELPDLKSFTPEQEAAVTRIQAAGRGMLDRKRVKALKDQKKATHTEGGESPETDDTNTAAPTAESEEPTHTEAEAEAEDSTPTTEDSPASPTEDTAAPAAEDNEAPAAPAEDETPAPAEEASAASAAEDAPAAADEQPAAEESSAAPANEESGASPAEEAPVEEAAVPVADAPTTEDPVAAEPAAEESADSSAREAGAGDALATEEAPQEAPSAETEASEPSGEAEPPADE